ncbi:DNA ligase 3 [Ataeniobius toweri]|uniref:DNA ligase 3 n=1 Tax=Ataeniobius toweri TaxID=208326 RepID=A0ABU7AI03_9TELE|nr:DNA ligase 3 [Ataeniobius toweri]
MLQLFFCPPGGIMSSFLMGCYDPDSKKWCTVTKCSGGYDDAMLARLQKELDVIKISKDPSKIPGWLNIVKNYYPDFIIRNPEQAPVWEITGAEFSKSEMHTADGISIRFPRMTRIRDDKDWKTATNLHQLRELFRISKENFDFKVTAGPSTSNDDKGSSGGDSGGNSPSSSSYRRAPSRKTSEYDSQIVQRTVQPCSVSAEGELGVIIRDGPQTSYMVPGRFIGTPGRNV